MIARCKATSPITWYDVRDHANMGRPVKPPVFPQCIREEGHAGLHRTAKDKGDFQFAGVVESTQ